MKAHRLNKMAGVIDIKRYYLFFVYFEKNHDYFRQYDF